MSIIWRTVIRLVKSGIRDSPSMLTCGFAQGSRVASVGSSLEREDGINWSPTPQKHSGAVKQSDAPPLTLSISPANPRPPITPVSDAKRRGEFRFMGGWLSDPAVKSLAREDGIK